jgi:hypothetical protein
MNRFWNMATPLSLAARPPAARQPKIIVLRSKTFYGPFRSFREGNGEEKKLSDLLRPTITYHGMNAVKRRLS